MAQIPPSAGNEVGSERLSPKLESVIGSESVEVAVGLRVADPRQSTHIRMKPVPHKLADHSMPSCEVISSAVGYSCSGGGELPHRIQGDADGQSKLPIRFPIVIRLLVLSQQCE